MPSPKYFMTKCYPHTFFTGHTGSVEGKEDTTGSSATGQCVAPGASSGQATENSVHNDSNPHTDKGKNT